MKSDELLNLLLKSGWVETRQRGSHKILKKRGIQEIIIFPYHKSKEVPTGTANSILKKAGLK
jgi:predicted RNA binding protein YcfA (HicA-like mRNA interferase family)